MAFTSTDRRLLNGLKEAMTNFISWKSGLDKDITSINSRINVAQSSASSASSLAKSASSTAIAAGQSASTARLGAQSATTAAATARDTATTAKDTAIEASNSLSATMKLVDEVAAKVNEGPPGLKTAINNLQDDMNGLKLSILVQTCSDLGTQEGDLRMYTSEECDAMNGNFNPPGECLKKEGGSYTYECGKLYKGKPVTTKAANSFFGSIASTKPAAQQPFNNSKPLNMSLLDQGGDVRMTAILDTAAKLGLRSSTTNGRSYKRGYSLPIESPYTGAIAEDYANSAFETSLDSGGTPKEAAALALLAAEEGHLKQKSMDIAKTMGLGALGPGLYGYSLPRGTYSSTTRAKADTAFEKVIAAKGSFESAAAAALAVAAAAPPATTAALRSPVPVVATSTPISPTSGPTATRSTINSSLSTNPKGYNSTALDKYNKALEEWRGGKNFSVVSNASRDFGIALTQAADTLGLGAERRASYGGIGWSLPKGVYPEKQMLAADGAFQEAMLKKDDPVAAAAAALAAAAAKAGLNAKGGRRRSKTHKRKHSKSKLSRRSK